MLPNVQKRQKSPQKEHIHDPFIKRSFLLSDCLYIYIYNSNSDFISVFVILEFICKLFHILKFYIHEVFSFYLVFISSIILIATQHLIYNFQRINFQIYWQSCASIFLLPFSIPWTMQISAFSFFNLFICVYFLLFLLVYVEFILKSTLFKTLVKFYFNIISNLYKSRMSRRTYLYAHYPNSPIVCILSACYITLYGYIIYII